MCVHHCVHVYTCVQSPCTHVYASPLYIYSRAIDTRGVDEYASMYMCVQVVLSVDVDPPREARASPATLTFTPGDWSDPRAVHVTGQPVSLKLGTVSVS